jgi:hypothetical protein
MSPLSKMRYRDILPASFVPDAFNKTVTRASDLYRQLSTPSTGEDEREGR